MGRAPRRADSGAIVAGRALRRAADLAGAVVPRPLRRAAIAVGPAVAPRRIMSVGLAAGTRPIMSVGLAAGARPIMSAGLAAGPRPLLRAVVAVGLTAVALPAAAQAGTPGRWEALHPGHATNVYQPALARDAAGDLHAAYVFERPDGSADLLERSISRAGALGAPRTVLGGYVGISDPALLAEGGGLRVLAGGQRTVETDEPIRGLLTATAPAAGGAWSAPSVTTTQEGEVGFFAGDVAAVALADGTPLALSSGTGFGVLAHRGLDPAFPAVSLQDQFAGCCIGQAQIVRDDRSGAAVAVYQSVITGNDGVFSQALDPATGAPASAPAALPGLGTAGGADGIDPVLARTAAAARVGGGVYVAVPSGLALPDRTRLWRVGGGGPVTLGTGGGRNYAAAVIPTPDGRLWVAWTREEEGVAQVALRRSNPSVTRFGQLILVDGPGGQRIFDLDGSSQALRLDLVGSGGTGATRPYHTQVLPPLELRASRRAFRGGQPVAVRFTVTDVGVPVSGATVRAGGQQGTSGAAGTVTLTLRGPSGGGRITARATKADYVRDEVTLVVRRRPPER
jgi:hypothetical protein